MAVSDTIDAQRANRRLIREFDERAALDPPA